MQNNNNNRTVKTASNQDEVTTDYFHGAAIIDDRGNETKITEEMIQDSLKAILKACNPPADD